MLSMGCAFGEPLADEYFLTDFSIPVERQQGGNTLYDDEPKYDTLFRFAHLNHLP